MIIAWIQAQAVKLLGGALVLALLAIPINGWIQHRQGVSEGREAVLADLREAQAKAAQKAVEAARDAGLKAAERADQNAAVIAEQIRTIEEAEAEGGNALDGLFSR